VTVSIFHGLIARDSNIRDAYVAYLDGMIAQENSLDRVSPSQSFDYQRGKVAGFRTLRQHALNLEKKGDTDEPVQS